MNRHLACVCILLLAAGCGEAGPTVPILTSVAGAYSATQFTVAEVGGEPVDYLGLGASIALTLNADGSTAGRIQVPDGGEDGALDESLLGTWTLTGTTVVLSHEADTFLRDMPLTVDGNALVGTATFGGVTIGIRLDR